MPNDSHFPDARQIRHADVAYEIRDLNHEPVFYFFLTLGIVISLVAFAMWGVFKHLGSSQYAGHRTTNPIMTSNEELKEIGGDPANSFPVPHLQPDPVADLNKFRIGEEEWLNSYGWVDPKQGKVHIPIERAIDIMSASWPQQEEQADETMPGFFPPTVSAPGVKAPEQAFTDPREGNYGW
ncbi:MAG TPA: hypothetical protein VMX38_06280 [Verrucomicrobiae bacterium]|nr:hypothetical protein [Verrucomicrobiae bacterium]